LKDYVNGKLLFCHPPPSVSETLFNEQTHQESLLHATGKKRAPATRVGKNADTFVPPSVPESGVEDGSMPAFGHEPKSQALDRAFFESNAFSSWPTVQGSHRITNAYSRPTSLPHQNIMANDGTPLSRSTIVGISVTGKKHKKMKRVKQRSGRGYD
jgi:large subunit GTPase 1